MRFDIVSIFPEFFGGPLDYGIVRRARQVGVCEVHVHDLRQWAHDRHRTVDDRPFGGGEGMVLKPEPLFEAVESLLGKEKCFSTEGTEDTEVAEKNNQCPAIVLLSAAGKLFRQETARRLARCNRIVLLCGRYEGVDERVAEHLATEELSIGDFVLSGGELPAALVVDAVTRLLPGALGNEASAVHESFTAGQVVTSHQPAPSDAEGSAAEGSPACPEPAASGRRITGHESPIASHGILDCPHYTRPQVYRGWAVPDVLLSGHHEEVRRWRRRMALAKTLRNRPDLLANSALSEEERRLLAELQELETPDEHR